MEKSKVIQKNVSYLDRLFEITPANNRLEDSQLTDIAEYVNLNINQLDYGQMVVRMVDGINPILIAWSPPILFLGLTLFRLKKIGYK